MKLFVAQTSRTSKYTCDTNIWTFRCRPKHLVIKKKTYPC